MSPQQVRTVSRALHLGVALIAGTLVYAPMVGDDTLRFLLAAVIFPILIVSGLVMWQQAAIRRLLRGRGAGGRHKPQGITADR